MSQIEQHAANCEGSTESGREPLLKLIRQSHINSSTRIHRLVVVVVVTQ